jgi:carboxymethylenebutenolidase
MSESPIDIVTPDGLADAWVFHPHGAGRWPVVILHTDIRGVRPAFRQAGQRLASQGYFVLLPNLYYRTVRASAIDPAWSLSDPAGRTHLRELHATITAAGLRRDHIAFLDALAREPLASTARIGIVGYCMSGSIALRAAADLPERVVAAASFHGGRLASAAADSPHVRAAEIRGRLYLGYAHEDQSMSAEQIAQLEQALTAANVNFTSEHYAAPHGFAVSDSPAYDAAMAERHWDRIAELFAATLKAAA